MKDQSSPQRQKTSQKVYTSYEERLALIQALQEGANSFLATIPHAGHLNGDGWDFTSLGSQFFNPNATEEK